MPLVWVTWSSGSLPSNFSHSRCLVLCGTGVVQGECVFGQSACSVCYLNSQDRHSQSKRGTSSYIYGTQRKTEWHETCAFQLNQKRGGQRTEKIFKSADFNTGITEWKHRSLNQYLIVVFIKSYIFSISLHIVLNLVAIGTLPCNYQISHLMATSNIHHIKPQENF